MPHTPRHVFSKEEDEALLKFGILPVHRPEEFFQFQDREALDLIGIACPLEQYSQETIETFYAALRGRINDFDRAAQGKGSLWQLNFSEQTLAQEMQLPQELISLAQTMRQAFERAVTPNIIKDLRYPETSFRINSTYPNKPHIHKGEYTPYAMAAYIDGETTIMLENDSKSAAQISFPQNSLALFLASKVWHQAADINTTEDSPDERLHIQLVSGQRHTINYDRYQAPDIN